MISIYLTPGHCSTTIRNGCSRETSAPSLQEMIAGMSVEDRETLRTVAQAIADAAAGDVTTAEFSRAAAMLEKA